MSVCGSLGPGPFCCMNSLMLTVELERQVNANHAACPDVEDVGSAAVDEANMCR